MTRSHAILTGPLFLALVSTAFCVWIALGNDVDICVTTGCTLYQDFTVFGVSLWWYGTGAFSVLALCALLGQGRAGRLLAAMFLLGDLCLLILMSVTAPCVNCLVVALLFAISYFMFRRNANAGRQGQTPPLRPSLLMWAWGIFFLVNLGQVLHAQFSIWPILDESEEAHSRMFFSPSCRHCAEGVNTLSGNINVAFYPVADNDQDVFRVARMKELLAEGMSLAEAFKESEKISEPGLLASLRPDIVLLRLHLLVNRAHILSAGSSRVPFFEYLGLPPYARAENGPTRVAGGARQIYGASPVRMNGDAALPVELEESTQCGADVPCDPQ